jgi:glycosyltransferase involved in cell wall biosynthesis
MQKIKLLYVITKLELGGAQKQLLSLITHLDKKRYTPSLITASDGLLVKNALSIKDLKLIRLRFLERPINPLKDLLALCQIYSFIKKNKIDIVHTHSSKAGILGRWAAMFAGAKIVTHTVHGWSFNEYQNYFLRKIIVWLEKLTALITDKLIVVSDHDLKKGLDNRIGNKEQYRLIRYGINYRDFGKRDKSLREKLGIGVDDLVIGMISCLKPQKSPQSFIRLAFLVNKALPQINVHKNTNSQQRTQISNKIRFLLVGDGVLRKKIESLIYNFNLEEQVILTGWREDIPQILSVMDIFVLTSLWEGLPISALEAMAASLPVVVTNTGGIAEIIREGKTGFLVFPDDMRIMADKVIYLLKDKNLRNQIGQNSKDSLDSDFFLENMIKQTEDFYQKLINSKLKRYAN